MIAAEIPRYISHKQVWALEISAVEEGKDIEGGKAKFVSFAEPGYAAIECPADMFARYTPVKGDFLVEYSDGYKSFSPRKAFLEGYSREQSPKQHQGLAVAGYQPQNSVAVHGVNENKKLEEQVLRQIDVLSAHKTLAVDARWLSIGRTAIEQGFMAINRSIFKPSRVNLPEDEDGD